MKKVFQVTLHLKDGSKNIYHVVANDDIEARSKSADTESKSYKQANEKYPGLEFAETALVCSLDAA